MKIIYSADVDIVRILFRDGLIVESNEAQPGVIFDYDQDGRVVGIEILNASQQMHNPCGIEYELLGVLPQ